jgi:cytochrome c556
MVSVKRSTRIIVSAAVLAVGMAGVALAADKKMPTKEESIVKYRQAVMMSQAGHMGAAADIIFGKVEFKDQLGAHVNALAATIKDIPMLFPKGTEKVGKTKALKKVWTENKEFKKKAKDAEEKAEALAKVVAAGDTAKYIPAFKDLGKACKACHKDFRKKEKK